MSSCEGFKIDDQSKTKFPDIAEAYKQALPSVEVCVWAV